MLYIPLLYFSSLFWILYKKRGMDAGSYCALLYAITSLFAVVLINVDPLYGTQYTPKINDEITFMPTLIYCIYPTLIILPICSLNTNAIKNVSIKNYTFLNVIGIYFFASLIILLLAYAQDFARNLFLASLEEMNDVKLSHQAMDKMLFTQYPLYIDIPLKALKFTSSMSYVSIFIYLFRKAYIPGKKWLNTITILGSLTGPVYSMLTMDRSRTIWWVIIFGLCFFMFWHHLNNHSKKELKKTSLYLLGVISIYFITVTIARFSQRDTGSVNALINYAGQSFPYFCYFYNNFTNPDGFAGKLLFPVFTQFFTDNPYADIGWQRALTMITGIDTGVFYTFTGGIYVAEGILGLFVFLFIYYFLWMISMQRKKSTVSFERLFCYFLLMIIPSTGCIAFFGGFQVNITTALLILYMIFCKWAYSKPIRQQRYRLRI